MHDKCEDCDGNFTTRTKITKTIEIRQSTVSRLTRSWAGSRYIIVLTVERHYNRRFTDVNDTD